jgi:hypothetical protein
MMRYAREGGFIALVNVNSLHWTSKCAVRGGSFGCWGLATDCMVKDEDFCGPSSIIDLAPICLLASFRGYGEGRRVGYVRVLQQLLCLLIILVLNLLIIYKVFFHARMLVKMEAISV